MTYEMRFNKGGNAHQYCENHNFWDEKNYVAASCRVSDLSDNAAPQVEYVAEPKCAQHVDNINIEQVVDFLYEVVRQQKRQF